MHNTPPAILELSRKSLVFETDYLKLVVYDPEATCLEDLKNLSRSALYHRIHKATSTIMAHNCPATPDGNMHLAHLCEKLLSGDEVSQRDIQEALNAIGDPAPVVNQKRLGGFYAVNPQEVEASFQALASIVIHDPLLFCEFARQTTGLIFDKQSPFYHHLECDHSFHDSSYFSGINQLEDILKMTPAQQRNFIQYQSQCAWVASPQILGRRYLCDDGLIHHCATYASQGGSFAKSARDYFTDQASARVAMLSRGTINMLIHNLRIGLILAGHDIKEYRLPYYDFRLPDDFVLRVETKPGFWAGHHLSIISPDGTESEQVDFSKSCEFLRFSTEVLPFLPAELSSSPSTIASLLYTYSSNRFLRLEHMRMLRQHLCHHRDSQGRKTALSMVFQWAYQLVGSEDPEAEIDLAYPTKITDAQVILACMKTGFILSTLTTPQDIEADDPENLHGHPPIHSLDLNGLNIHLRAMKTVSLHPVFQVEPDGYVHKVGYKKRFEAWSDDIHSAHQLLSNACPAHSHKSWEPSMPPAYLGTHDERTYTAFPLHRYSDIHEEGRLMQHCAGQYANHCKNGQYYLWSIQSCGADGVYRRESTLGMSRLSNGLLAFDQHYAHKNEFPEEHISRMADDFIDALCDELQKVNGNYPLFTPTRYIETDPATNNAAQALNERIGLDIYHEDFLQVTAPLLASILGEAFCDDLRTIHDDLGGLFPDHPNLEQIRERFLQRCERALGLPLDCETGSNAVACA